MSLLRLQMDDLVGRSSRVGTLPSNYGPLVHCRWKKEPTRLPRLV